MSRIGWNVLKSTLLSSRLLTECTFLYLPSFFTRPCRLLKWSDSSSHHLIIGSNGGSNGRGGGGVGGSNGGSNGDGPPQSLGASLGPGAGHPHLVHHQNHLNQTSGASTLDHPKYNIKYLQQHQPHYNAGNQYSTMPSLMKQQQQQQQQLTAGGMLTTAAGDCDSKSSSRNQTGILTAAGMVNSKTAGNNLYQTTTLSTFKRGKRVRAYVSTYERKWQFLWTFELKSNLELQIQTAVIFCHSLRNRSEKFYFAIW